LQPDQVLILVNGKRRYTSSLININNAIGRGSVATDMNSIAPASIDKIEVLRDGAAAQYGSDAIAGVINVLLKKSLGTTATYNVGQYNTKNFLNRHIKDGDVIEPDRWPSGNPETGYLDTDGSPTKTVILAGRRKGEYLNFWDLAFGKRPPEELYDISKDPYCMTNLATDKSFAKIKDKLKTKMEKELKSQNDPRMFGKGYVFDQYLHGEPKVRNFYERYMKGEPVKAYWVNESDFEKKEK
jgi:hypothetical protein